MALELGERVEGVGASIARQGRERVTSGRQKKKGLARASPFSVSGRRNTDLTADYSTVKVVLATTVTSPCVAVTVTG